MRAMCSNQPKGLRHAMCSKLTSIAQSGLQGGSPQSALPADTTDVPLRIGSCDSLSRSLFFAVSLSMSTSFSGV